MEFHAVSLPGIDFPVIDAHAHPYLNRDCPRTGPVDFDAYQRDLETAGISCFCGSCNIPNDGTDPDVAARENREVLRWRDHFGEHYYPGCNIHPNFPEASIREVEKFHAMGFRWVGEVAAYVQGYENFASPGMYTILDRVRELGMTFNCHPTSFPDLEKLASDLPGLTIVVAHPGLLPGGVPAMYDFAEKHPNVLLDLSGGGLPRWHMLRWGVDRLGPERILFGTDYPVMNPVMYVQGALAEPLTAAERRAVLHDNFVRLTAK